MSTYTPGIAHSSAATLRGVRAPIAASANHRQELDRGHGGQWQAVAASYKQESIAASMAPRRAAGANRCGRASGDMNPIHMHPLSARLFGFPSAIAHGMWTKARCLAALEPGLPERFAVEVAFRRPILLPATVQFAEQAENGCVQFGVRDASKATPHLDGQLSSV